MDLAAEIIEESRKSIQPPNAGWLAKVPREHHEAIFDVRSQWRKSGGTTSGVTASRLARIIVEKLEARGVKTSGYRQVQRWLTAKD